MAKTRRNVYRHSVSTAVRRIPNGPRPEFRRALEQLPYLAYEVEVPKDGRKILITKRGGKFTRGGVRREDFMVWVYDPSNGGPWLISHKDICKALVAKGNEDPRRTAGLIGIFERVFAGDEPESLLPRIMKMEVDKGESAELLLKAYKWIWGQEDCNYPDGLGREMSMAAIRELREDLVCASRKRARRTL